MHSNHSSHCQPVLFINEAIYNNSGCVTPETLKTINHANNTIIQRV